MRTLRARLIISHTLPVLVIFPLLALLVYLVFASQNSLSDVESALEQEATRLADQVALLAQISGQVGEIWSDSDAAQEFVAKVNLELSTIMLLDADGRILASSNATDAARLGEILQSDDVRAILSGQSQIEINYSDPAGRRIAEVLMPVRNADQQLSGVIRMSQELARIQQRFDRVYLLLLTLIVSLLVAGVLLGLFLALRLERSLQRVTAALHGIAIGQPPDALPEQGVAEIDQLYRAVDALAERLQALEAARRRLLANLVHELGRPLGSLRAAIHALRHGADEDIGLRHELLSGMDHQIALMQPLLEDLTRLHGQLLGSLELNRQPMELSQWLPKVVALWRETAQQKGLQWRADIPLDLPAAEIDAEQLGRALGNLLSNAVKFTPIGGSVSVEVGASAEPASWWLRVSDSGPGIAADELETIFEPFHRGQSVRRFPQGMGLGLTIAHDVITAHGGKIDVDSSPGAGARFTVTLPLLSSSS